MKRVLTILSALLIVTGLKAQKANVQKETVKPRADSLVKNSANTQLSKTSVQQKDVKLAPQQKEATAIKYAPAAKITPASVKAQKETPVKH